MDLANLVANAFAGAGEEDQQVHATESRILDAAVQEAAAQGMRALTAEGVARRANVSRVTVYRRFEGRDGLLAAMVMREGKRMAAAVTEAVDATPTPSEKFVAGFATAIRRARQHPIISRVAALEPEELIAAGMANDAALLRLGSEVVAAMIRDQQELGFAQHVDAEQAGETLARLFAALVLIPAQHAIDLSTEETTRNYVRKTLGPMILGTSFEPVH